MKKFLVVVVLFLGIQGVVFGQNGGESTHYTLGQLDAKNKLELAKIYVDQVHKLNLLLPYIPFNQKGDAVSLAGMGIPNTKDNNEMIKNLDTSSGTHNESLDVELTKLIPYSDKSDIIKAILFIQDVIERVENGL